MIEELIQALRLLTGRQDVHNEIGFTLFFGGIFALILVSYLVAGVYSIIHTLIDQPSRVANARAQAEIARANADIAIAHGKNATDQSTALANALSKIPQYAPPAQPNYTQRPSHFRHTNKTPVRKNPTPVQPDDGEHVTEQGGRLLIEIPGTAKDIDKGFVYIIKGATHYKIGKARNIQDRLKQLATGHEHGLTVYHSIASNAMGRAEASLHTRFAALRGRGEWFNLTETQLEYLKSIARIDVAGFPETQPATTPDDLPTVAHSGEQGKGQPEAASKPLISYKPIKTKDGSELPHDW